MSEDQAKYEVEVKQTTPATLLNLAINQGADLDRLEKLMMLQDKWEENQARKAYYEAVAEFKKNPPQVHKDMENSQFSKANKKSMYVSLGNLVTTVNPALGAHGLSASWDISQNEKAIKITCKLAHRQGYSETVTMESAPDSSGAKNPIQQIKSTITYLRAITFEAVTGLAATGEANQDDDGNGTMEYITDQQLSTITDMINDKGVDRPKFLAYIKAEATEKILAKDFGKAMAALKVAKGGAK